MGEHLFQFYYPPIQHYWLACKPENPNGPYNVCFISAEIYYVQLSLMRFTSHLIRHDTNTQEKLGLHKEEILISYTV